MSAISSSLTISSIAVRIEVARDPSCPCTCLHLKNIISAKCGKVVLSNLVQPSFSDSLLQSLIGFATSIRIYVEPDDYRSKLSCNDRHTLEDFSVDQEATQSTYIPVINTFVHVFDLSEGMEEEDYMEDEQGQADPSAASHSLTLPSTAYLNLWDSLYFETDIKRRLLEYVDTALLFSEKGVNSDLVDFNNVILLHGPAGSGKTSLCKAMAQKVTIRLSERYSYGQLVEINSHSLFSKWFSESGKLVMKMFDRIHEMIQDPKGLIFLLIDEVESLAKSRQASEAGNEPGDSLRAVNALLTQIDKLKRYPNVLILTTSNLVGSIDHALLDRADMKIYIGSPPPSVIYQIYVSSLKELIRVGIITADPLPSNGTFTLTTEDSQMLLEIATLSTGLSGRTLRKIPFLAHANFRPSCHSPQEKSSLTKFLPAMKFAVERELTELQALQNPLPKPPQSSTTTAISA